MSEKTNSPMRLHDASCTLRGARNVLMNLHDTGVLFLDGMRGKDAKVYNQAAYELLMTDEVALWEWLATPNTPTHIWEYYDHERDKKGKLVRCKAKRYKNV